MKPLCTSILTLVTLLHCLSAFSEDRRPDKSVLILMSLNAEFLWDGAAPEEGSADFPWKGSVTEAEQHMAAVAELIIRSNPDIVNLVEVENLTSLTKFNTKFLANRGYKPYLVQGNDSSTGQDVALLTRIDPEGDAIGRDDRKGQAGNVKKSVSKNYVAKFQMNQKKVALVGAHFLAFPLSFQRKLDREAQADAIRSVAVELAGQGFAPIVLGDLNDYDGALESKDHIDSTPISQVLKTVRGMNPNDQNDDLTNALAFVPKAMRYTAWHDANQNEAVDPPNEFTAIDHVLIPPSLAPLVELVEIPHNHDPRHVTDHFPVVVHFRFGTSGPTSSDGTVRIASLLPNPEGDDAQNESVTLTNKGGTTVSLTGWKLRDRAGTTWTLDALGSLGPQDSKTITRSGQAMSLNNQGDTVELINSLGAVVHSFTYQTSEKGEPITVP